MLQFVLIGMGTVNVDRVELVHLGTGENVLANNSFEDGIAGWGSAFGGEQAAGDFGSLHVANVGEYGTYTIALRAIDEDGVVGLPHTEVVTHSRCE